MYNSVCYIHVQNQQGARREKTAYEQERSIYKGAFVKPSSSIANP